MSACGACGGEYRKGTMAIVFSKNEPPKRKRVCPTCAGKGLLVCAKTTVTTVTKTVRSDAVESTLRQLTTYAKLANANGQTERAEALESAIQTLRRASS